MLTRWQILGVGILVESIGGVFYAFGLYSDLLKSTFNLTQEKLDLISTFALLGGNLGVQWGLLYDKLGTRGPMVVMIIALVAGSSGWLGMWSILHFSLTVPYAVLLLLSFLSGQGQMTLDISTISTCTRNFPEHRGLSIGLLKSFVGLSGAIAGQIFKGSFQNFDDNCAKSHTSTMAPQVSTHAPEVNVSMLHDGSTQFSSMLTESDTLGFGYMDQSNNTGNCKGTIMFILFLGIEVFCITLLGSFTVRQAPPKQPETTDSHARVGKTLTYSLFATIFLAILAAVSSLVEMWESSLGWNKAGLMGVVVATFIGIIIFTATRKDPLPLNGVAYNEGDMEREKLLEKAGGINTSDDDEPMNEIKNYTLFEALCTPYFWIICSCFFVGGGSGLVINANLAQIIPTLEHHPAKADNEVFTTLFSVFNCIGRLLAGLLGDYLLKTRGIPRPIVYAGGMLLMCGSQILLISGQYNLLFPATIMCGLAYGSFNSLCTVGPTIISELFGVKNFGIIYATNSLGLAAGNYAMATYMSSHIYQSHDIVGTTCVSGPACYRLSFIICAIGTGAMTLVMLALVPMTKMRYRQLYPKFYLTKA